MTRIAAVLLPLGVIVFVISTAVFHPHRENPMNHEAVFQEYAQNESWIVVHFAQWLASLMLCGGLAGFYYSLKSTPDSGAGAAARFGLIGTVLTAGAFTMLQAVDGIALKWAVDAWSGAAIGQKESLFAAAMSVRWTEYALQSYANLLLGITLLLYALAMVLGTGYPRWLGWLAAGSGVFWLMHGSKVPYVGLFDSIFRLAAIVLLALWSFIVPFFLWRSKGRSVITQSA